METKLFKALAIGQRFRMKNWPQTEWIKIEPIRTPEGRIRYNAVSADGELHHRIGHGGRCLLPPYDPPSPRPPSTWTQLNAKARAAGWKNVTELHKALLAGVVEVPRKPVG